MNVTLKEIQKECEYEEFYTKKLDFSCLSDGFIVYTYYRNGTTHEFKVVADDSFDNEETVKTLLAKKRLEIIEHNIYLGERQIHTATYQSAINLKGITVREDSFEPPFLGVN